MPRAFSIDGRSERSTRQGLAELARRCLRSRLLRKLAKHLSVNEIAYEALHRDVRLHQRIDEAALGEPGTRTPHAPWSRSSPSHCRPSFRIVQRRSAGRAVAGVAVRLGA